MTPATSRRHGTSPPTARACPPVRWQPAGTTCYEWHEAWLFTDPDPSLRAYRFYRAAGWRHDGVEGGNRVMRKVIRGGPEDESASR